jgi:Ni/Fe-hydrogenase subunit HybB-like protein
MQTNSTFHSLEGRSASFWFVLGFLLAVLGAAGLSSLYMEHNGHWVTGMTNQIVWGLPHVCAFFLILAASGALNVASIGSVLGKEDYKPLGRMSALLALALLAGGLAVLVLDLGRTDRLDLAMTNFNFTSIFAFNIFLYTGFMGLGLLYLWVMIDKRMAAFYRLVATSAFIWRLILTTGTGSILGFLVSRTGYHTALMAPMFISFSLSFGMAMFVIVLAGVEFATAEQLDLSPELLKRMRILFALLIAVSAYMVAVHHVTNIYSAERRGLTRFLLVDGGIFPIFFWLGFVALGTILPLILLFAGSGRFSLAVAAICAAMGGIALVYVYIVGAQAYPIEIFPGKIVTSAFYDGIVSTYHPKLPEFLLGFGGFSLAAMLVMVGLWVLPMLPDPQPAKGQPRS